jgi:hypothetical protein
MADPPPGNPAMTPDNRDAVFAGLFNLPGEGLVAEIRSGGESMLFDRRGLQYRIIQRRQKGLATSAEEEALNRMDSIHPLGDR